MRRGLRWLSIVVWCWTCALIAVPSIQAQSTDAERSASARALFKEGVAYTDAGRWPEAEARFRRALALRPSPVIRYNLASALIEQGRLVEALSLLEHVERDPASSAQLVQEARGLRENHAQRVASLTIRARGDTEQVSFTLDDRTLEPGELGVALPMDPGEHTVRALREGAAPIARRVVLTEGGAEILTLGVDAVASPREAARTVVPAATHPEQIDGTGDAGARKKRMWWGIGGAAAAVVVIAVVTGVVAGNNSRSEREPAYQGDFDPPSIAVNLAP